MMISWKEHNIFIQTIYYIDYINSKFLQQIVSIKTVMKDKKLQIPNKTYFE